MKSYKVHTYGDPLHVIACVEEDQPVPASDEILIEVKATSINDYDYCVTSGIPLSYRLLFGLFKQKKRYTHLGMEVAGKVVGVGSKVTKFKIGDRVFGDTSDHKM